MDTNINTQYSCPCVNILDIIHLHYADVDKMSPFPHPFHDSSKVKIIFQECTLSIWHAVLSIHTQMSSDLVLWGLNFFWCKDGWQTSPARRQHRHFGLHTNIDRKKREGEKRNVLFFPILLISHRWSFIVPLFYCSFTDFYLCRTLMNRFCYFMLLITAKLWAKLHYTPLFED